MNEELNESEEIVLDDDTQGNSGESNDSDPDEGESESDKFGGDYKKLLKSYQALEGKLGSHGQELGALRQELEQVSQKARVANSAAEALAARDGISVEEALKRIDSESQTLREKFAPKIQERQASEEMRELRLKLERQELLSEFPEAKSILDVVMDYAKATGKSPKELYEKKFKNLVPVTMNAQKTHPKPVYRSADSDEEPSTARAEKKLRERLAQSRTANDYKQAAHELLKHKLFGNK